MSIKTAIGAIFITTLAVTVGWLAIKLVVAILAFNRLRQIIIKAAQQIPHDKLRHIYELVEACGTEPHNGYILAKTNLPGESGRNEIRIPDDIPDFPWAGRSFEIHLGDEVSFNLTDHPDGGIQIGGRIFLPVRIPRKMTKSGKLRNDFMPRIYLSKKPELRSALEEQCPGYSEELLSYLLCAGRESHEFDPIDQARIGTSVLWVQMPEYRKCPDCRKTMTLILQLPGILIQKKPLGDGTIYLFGCREHPERTATVIQYS